MRTVYLLFFTFAVAPCPSAVRWSDDPEQRPPQVDFQKQRKVFLLESKEITPLSVLELMLGGDFFERIADETNTYARQNLRPSHSTSHMKAWYNVDREEMKKFFGVLIVMGIHPNSTFDMFWSKRFLYHCPFFSATMSRNRFQTILSYLHVADNNNTTDLSSPNDPLQKIRPFVDTLSFTFNNLYYPGKELSLDEGTCPFKGRLNFVTYNPNKPNKWGIKLYQVCDSMTGYCCKFKIAAGESVSTKSLVLDLLSSYLGKGHEIYMDRYYTSMPLFEELFQQNTIAVGTCMSNRRGLPKDLINQKFKKREISARRHGAVMALKWRDQREVLVLSTKHTPAMQVVSVRAPGGRVEKLKPVAIHDYNKNMAGVDKSDQLMQYYSFKRKTIKWWKKVFFHLFNLALMNSQKLYNLWRINNKKKTVSLLDYSTEIAEALTSSITTPKATHHDSSSSFPISFPDQLFSPENYHRLEKIPKENPPYQRECYVCKKKYKWGRVVLH